MADCFVFISSFRNLASRKPTNNEATMAKDKYVRFDWAAKRMLQGKANFGVPDSERRYLHGTERRKG